MLTGKVAVITGAGRGIGKAAAKLFAIHGAKVVVNDMSKDHASETVEEIKQQAGVNGGDAAMVYAGSVTGAEFAASLAEATYDEYGKCDILVNNAGFLFDGVVHKMTDEQWSSVIECHGTSVFRLIRAFAPMLRDTAKKESEGSGNTRPTDRCIINVSSTSGLHGNVGQANYAFAKAGIVGLTKTIAKEWGPWSVRCNAVAFGMIDTRMTNALEEGGTEGGANADEIIPPQGLPEEVAKMWKSLQMLKTFVPLARMGTPEEAAGGMLFLASPLATYITGHTLEVTGGMGI